MSLPAVPVPLTADQRDLAARPEHIRLARLVARRYARQMPPLADEFEGEALLALCQVARRFDPARGLAFATLAVPRIDGACRDLCRSWGRGPGWHAHLRRTGIEPPRFAGPADAAAIAGMDSGDLPVGWEVESEDAVLAMVSRAGYGPPRAILVRQYLHADTRTVPAAARHFGRSRDTGCRWRAVALDAIRKAAREDDYAPR